MEHTQGPNGETGAPSAAVPSEGAGQHEPAIPSEAALAQAGVDASAASFQPLSIDSDVLFDDGLPRPNQDGGFKGATAARAAGISYRQLDYWARTGLVEPTVRGAQGSGSQRLYGFRDILVLKLVKRLLDTGISLQQIRTAVAQLHEAGVHDLSQTTLMSDGASVYLCTSSDEVIDLMSRGQGVFGIAIGKVLREVETSLVSMDEHREEAAQSGAAQASSVDELAARRKGRKIS